MKKIRTFFSFHSRRLYDNAYDRNTEKEKNPNHITIDREETP